MNEVDNKQDLDRELNENKKMLVLFYATWCPYCSSFMKAFNQNVAIRGFEKILRVNLDDYDNQLWDDYCIEAVPTVIFFENCKISSRLDGRSGVGLSEKQLKNWLQQLNIS